MRTDDTPRHVENVSVTLESGMHFVGEVGGFRVVTDADDGFGGAGCGPQPLRLLLLGVAGCTAMDVISILRKRRQRVGGLEMEARGSRVGKHPKVYGAIEIVYRYCPAIAMVGQHRERVRN